MPLLSSTIFDHEVTKSWRGVYYLLNCFSSPAPQGLVLGTEVKAQASDELAGN